LLPDAGRVVLEHGPHPMAMPRPANRLKTCDLAISAWLASALPNRGTNMVNPTMDVRWRRESARVAPEVATRVH